MWKICEEGRHNGQKLVLTVQNGRGRYGNPRFACLQSTFLWYGPFVVTPSFSFKTESRCHYSQNLQEGNPIPKTIISAPLQQIPKFSLHIRPTKFRQKWYKPKNVINWNFCAKRRENFSKWMLLPNFSNKFLKHWGDHFL